MSKIQKSGGNGERVGEVLNWLLNQCLNGSVPLTRGSGERGPE